jgi:hypothetical protein
MLSLIAPKFGMDYDVNEWGADQRAASMRLEEYARVCATMKSANGYLPTPQMVLDSCAEWAQVNPQMDRHPAFQDFYQDWWQSDQGRTAEPLLRLVVQEVWQLHDQGGVKQAQEVVANQVAASAPQQAVMEQQHEQEMAAMAESEQGNKDQAVQEAIGQQMLKERDREHETESQMALKEHETGLELVKQEHAASLQPKEPKSSSQK